MMKRGIKKVQTPGGLLSSRMALMQIRDSRLYRAEFGTFEAYCKGRWKMGIRHAQRLMASAGVIENTRPTGRIPTTERQTRPLSKLPPKQQAEAWQEAVETAPNNKPTAKTLIRLECGCVNA